MATNLVDVTDYTDDMLATYLALTTGGDDDGAAQRLTYKQAWIVFRDAGVKMPAGWVHLFDLEAAEAGPKRPYAGAGSMDYEGAILAQQEWR